VYGLVVTRTNIDIDDDLVARVMRRFDLPSKRAAVDLALRRLLGDPMTRDEILALQGVGWSGDLEAARQAEAGELG
jgi:Arc/MetJ family transcription regulator